MKRYPLEQLIIDMGCSPDEARRRLRISGGAYNAFQRHGLTLDQAERYAERAGLLPYEVWPDLLDEVIEAHTRVCADERCDNTFIPTNPRRIYCSTLCRDRRHKARWARRRYQTDAEYRAAQIERTNRYHHEVIVSARERRRAS